MKPALVAFACLVAVGCSDDPARSVKIIARQPEAASVAASSPIWQQNLAPSSSPEPCPPAANKSWSVACADTPSRTVKIVARRTSQATAAASTSQGPLQSLLPEFCPPPAEEASGPGNFTVNGPCEFRRQAPVACESLQDDFVVAATQKAKSGASLVIYLNVEHYHGPGDYDEAQMFVALQSGTTIRRWSNDNVHAIVGPGETFVVLPESRLDAEPARMECSRLIGPESNYQFQCAGISESNPAIDSSVEMISGNLGCAATAKD